jgi:hypothetical protein
MKIRIALNADAKIIRVSIDCPAELMSAERAQGG